jgi:adenylate kinase family enzyme
MKTNFTFDDVCKFLKDGYPDLKDDIDAFLSLLILFSPLCFSNPATSTLTAIGVISDLLGVKGAIVQLGEKLLKKITSTNDDPVDKYQRMQVAYTLICYTAFFDSLDNTIPDIMSELKLKGSEKKWLSQSAIDKLRGKEDENISEIELPKVIYKELDLPHPANNFDIQKKQLIPIYEELSKGFATFLESFAIWENAKDADKAGIMESLKKLPNQAYERFEAQYYFLSTKYEEFYIWGNLHQQKRIREEIKGLSAYLQKHVELTNSELSSVDVGMKGLTNVISLIPEQTHFFQANKAIEELKTCYRARIEEPVAIDIAESVPKGLQSLTYPKKSEIFIPQAFQVIRYSGKSLEDDETWKDTDIKDNLGTFLLSYFTSPYSTISPLIILGHPGSGKSLLTSIIAARFAISPYTPIRVTLREVDADSEIPVQVEEQIRQDTQRQVSWANLADTFCDNPSLIILDGYDELLQASGKVYSGYLKKVQQFQQNELHLGRKPVRSIVTSRITLIDKADIPHGATIIRLHPFNDKKRERWATIWNNINKQYFEQRQLSHFIVPQSKKLIDLAEQPLLLLMLAIYDSESNLLQTSQELDQTVLYDRLLRRFIKRELEKDENFLELPSEERNGLIEFEMERLGVVALGMFNRRKIQIKVSELNQDLLFFKLERKIQQFAGAILSEADLLLGSFFFVHESKSGNFSSSSNGNSRDTAFEFLHNTFGEFLAAEFILRKIVKVCKSLSLLHTPDLKEEYSNKLNRTDEFPSYCLAFAPLFARPVVISMMQEWINHKLAFENLNTSNFLEELDAIVQSEIKRILLTKNQLPKILTGTLENNPFPSVPLLGHIAIYSLNLIILRIILSPNGYVFDEDKISLYFDGTRAWDRLTFLWRSWFSLENLNGATAIFSSERDQNKIRLQTKNSFSTSSSSNKLKTILNVSKSLSDNILLGLAGVQCHDLYHSDYSLLNEYKQKLESEDIDIELEFLIQELNFLELSENYIDLKKLFNRIVEFLREQPFPIANPGKIAFLIERTIRIAHSFFGKKTAVHIFNSFYTRYARLESVRLKEDQLNIFDVLGTLAIKLGIEIENKPFLAWRYKHLFVKYQHHNISYKLVVESIKLLRIFGYQNYLNSPHTGKSIISIKNKLNYIESFDKISSNQSQQKLLDVFYLTGFNDFFKKYLFTEKKVHFLPVELIIELIRLAREFNDQIFLEFLYRDYLQEKLEYLVENDTQLELDTEIIVELIKLAREFNDKPFLELLYQQYLIDGRKLFRKYYELTNLDGEFIVEVIKLAREFDDKNYLILLYNELKKGNQKFLLKLYNSIELEAKLIIEVINLAKDCEDKELIKILYSRYISNFKLNINSLSIKDLRALKEISLAIGDENTVQQINVMVQESFS